MPNRNVEGNYRYGYQGQYAEKEPELGSGINSFELRLWDSRIGRWLSPDPYGQFASPYLGMGNNPIRNVDPDGGFTCDTPPCPESALGTEARFNFLSGVWDDFSGHTLSEVVVFGSSGNAGGGQGFDLVNYWVHINASAEILNKIETLNTGKTAAFRAEELQRNNFVSIGYFEEPPVLGAPPPGLDLIGPGGGLKILNAFKGFNKANYRHNLKVLTGQSGKGMDAHHIFAQKFETFFTSKNINIHHAEYMKWWNVSPHRSAAKAYNKEWEFFIFNKPNATRQQVIDFGNNLMKKYGF